MQDLENLLAEAKSCDPERSLCALFAAPAARPAILALIILDQELARVPHAVSQPLAGMIRYQWWREALAEAAAGRPRDMSVLRALSPGLRSGRIEWPLVSGLLEAREADLEPAPLQGLEAIEVHAAGRAGRLHELIGLANAANCAVERAQARLVGIALALGSYALRPPPGADGLKPEPVRARGRVLIRKARDLGRPSRAVLPAVLPAIVAARTLRHTGQPTTVHPLLPLRLWIAAALRRF